MFTIIFLRKNNRPAFPWLRHARGHSQSSDKDGAHTRTEMLSAGFGMDTSHLYRPGGLLVVLCVRGGALYM